MRTRMPPQRGFIALNLKDVARKDELCPVFSYFCTKLDLMRKIGLLVEDADHRAFYSIKYTFIRNGLLNISNNEVFKQMLDEYVANHPEILEIPDFTYDNYIAKSQRAADKRGETIRRRRGRANDE